VILVVPVRNRRSALSPVEKEVCCRDLGSPRTPATSSLDAAASGMSVVVLDLCWESSAHSQRVLRLVREVNDCRWRLKRAAAYRQ